MTAYKLIVAERADLANVTICCAGCSTETSVAIEKAAIPENCPSCGDSVPAGIRTALGHLQRFHQAAGGAEAKKTALSFAIRTPDKA